MPKVSFKISARTAKLIGRENFSNPEGAIVELVKNCYDADAKNCLVVFDISFETVPNELSISDYRRFAYEPLVKDNYKRKGKIYQLGANIGLDKAIKLQEFFFRDNAIYVIDNGHGMTKDVVTDQWMEIGTDNKETSAISVDGRVLTGAKGIGRFALDRLGFISEMWTVSKKNRKGCTWKMNWKQFDQPKKGLSEITADIEDAELDLKFFLKAQFKGRSRILNILNATNFSHGTVIKISSVKDNWSESMQESVFKSLEALVPPQELGIPFKVNFYSLADMRLFGEVETAFFNDFDYKVEAHFHAASMKLNLEMTRNELDLKEVKSKYAELFKNTKKPYDIATLSSKTFTFSRTAFEILKLEKATSLESRLRKLGDFSFSFYYLKNSASKDYPYRDFNTGERQKVLKRFGGIKIYRDSFRVRPYGDIGNDWLKLGDRGAQSPAGAGQRIGDWRVGPNQVAGLVKISRLKNPGLADKSDRGSLIENEYFDILRSLVTGVINVFEIDRSTILNLFYIETKRKEELDRFLQIRKEAEKIADEIIIKRNKVEREIYGTKPDLFREAKNKVEKEEFQKIIESGIGRIEKKDDEDAELAQVRTLASLGIIVTSFAHELKNIKNNLEELENFEKIFYKVVPDEQKKKNDFINGIDILELLKKDNERISHWVNYSLNAIKKDKRKRAPLQFNKYFSGLYKTWAILLDDRFIKLNIKNNNKRVYNFRAFEMDMNTIFNNLISNSIESFNKLKVIRKRIIQVSFKVVGDKMQILYHDNGVGLDKIFRKNKDEIFLPFVTTKEDKNSNEFGTGLGMYLVKSVVDDNNGRIEILDSTVGFKLLIEFPVRKK
ncbi:MAG: sensor histidine kinase [Sphingobacteriales bacterium]|nr:sensor histidine kinase [Sphingobacteriales bacterium]